MTKRGESDGFSTSDFARLVQEYLKTNQPLEYVVVNDASFPERTLHKYTADGQYPVPIDIEQTEALANHVVQAPLLSAGIYLRHDPLLLAHTIMSIVSRERAKRSVLAAGDRSF
jgi:hypothetical protein